MTYEQLQARMNALITRRIKAASGHSVWNPILTPHIEDAPHRPYIPGRESCQVVASAFPVVRVEENCTKTVYLCPLTITPVLWRYGGLREEEAWWQETQPRFYERKSVSFMPGCGEPLGTGLTALFAMARAAHQGQVVDWDGVNVSYANFHFTTDAEVAAWEQIARVVLVQIAYSSGS